MHFPLREIDITCTMIKVISTERVESLSPCCIESSLNFGLILVIHYVIDLIPYFPIHLSLKVKACVNVNCIHAQCVREMPHKDGEEEELKKGRDRPSQWGCLT